MLENITVLLLVLSLIMISIGGFMDVLDGADWPLERTSFAETLMFSHFSPESMFYIPSGMLNPIYMYMTMSQPFVRADSSHSDYVEIVNSLVLTFPNSP